MCVTMCALTCTWQSEILLFYFHVGLNSRCQLAQEALCAQYFQFMITFNLQIIVDLRLLVRFPAAQTQKTAQKLLIITLLGQ